MTGPALPGVVHLAGREYRTYQGRICLNWRDRTVLHHPEGCVLCCDFRVVSRPGGPPTHPGDACPRCGRRWEGRRPDLCVFCRRTCHFLDDDRRPVHKVCLENALTAALAAHPEHEGRDAA